MSSTFIFKLQHQKPPQITYSMFTKTKEIVYKTFSLKNKRTGEVHSFVLNLIDSPGTFEIRASDDEFERRSTDELRYMIKKCLKQNITHLNLVVMCIPFADNINGRVVASVKLLLKLFGSKKLPVVLCITHADSTNESKRQRYRKKIERHQRLQEFFDANLFQVIFMGCVNHTNTDFYDIKDLKRRYEDVVTWRINFLSLIFNSKERMRLYNIF